MVVIMKIEVLQVGELRCNCYLLSYLDSVLVIDPGDEVDRIISKIGNRKLLGIIITHYHFDHIGAIEGLVNKYQVMIYDKSNLDLKRENVIDKFKFMVIETPGHKEDAITIYFKYEGVMFCGDFIFRDGIGRCDLDGGNYCDMLESIQKIKKYPRDTVIYPGHGDCSTLGYEMDNNIYFRDDVKYF